jgi:hypothetical protein
MGNGMSMFSFLPPFYFGAYPTPALFAWLGIDQAQLDASGYGRSAAGLWERKNGNFTTASPQRDILETVTPQLRLIDAIRPAQAWLHAGDISRSKLTNLVNGLFYRGAKNVALGNARFLQELSTQLHVSPDACLKVAEQLTDARLVSPIGGSYRLNQTTGSSPTWVLTSLPTERTRLLDGLFEAAPPDYTAPLLLWLRGLDADAALDQRTLSLHAEIEMQQNAGTGGVVKSPNPATAFPAIPGLPSFTVPPMPATPGPIQSPPTNSAAPKPEDLPPPKPQPAR